MVPRAPKHTVHGGVHGCGPVKPAGSTPGQAPPPLVQTLLLVDDEADIVESLKDLLEVSLPGIVVRTASGGAAGLKVLEKEPIQLIITDYKMPGMNGLEFLAKAHAVAPSVPRILITAFPDLDIAVRAINDAGIESFITKPFDPAFVVDTVRTVLAEQKAEVQRNQGFARSLDVLRRQLAEKK